MPRSPRRVPRSASPVAHASATIADMRNLATTPSPDARLLVACDQLSQVLELANALYRAKGAGHLAAIRDTFPDRDALVAELIRTPARTPLGRRAKAQAAKEVLGGAGSIFALACSALDDFMTNGASTGMEMRP